MSGYVPIRNNLRVTEMRFGVVGQSHENWVHTKVCAEDPLVIPNETKLFVPSKPGPAQVVAALARSVQVPAAVTVMLPGVPVCISKRASAIAEL